MAFVQDDAGDLTVALKDLEKTLIEHVCNLNSTMESHPTNNHATRTTEKKRRDGADGDIRERHTVGESNAMKKDFKVLIIAFKIGFLYS